MGFDENLFISHEVPEGQESSTKDSQTQTEEEHHQQEVADQARDVEDSPVRLYATVYEFVEEFLVHMVPFQMSTSAGSGLRWDPDWHKYPFVVHRLISLHEAFEASRVAGGTAMSSWWIQHFDPHMRQILDGHGGPFHEYDEHGLSVPPPALRVSKPKNRIASFDDAPTVKDDD